MATTELGAALTAQQRAQQIRLRVVTLRDLLRLWQAFDPKNISRSWTILEPALVALVQSRRPMSEALAGQYLADFRRAEQITGSTAAVMPDPLTADEIIPNLRILGPGNAHRLENLVRLDVAKVTLTNIEGEVTRQTLNGGRQTIVDTTLHDRKARGYTRVTDGSPCSFCALLAGRGPVYNSEDSGDFPAHLKCGCTAEPVYFTDSPWPPSAAQWRDLYAETAKAVPKNTPDRSAEIRREFRRRYEATTAN